MTHGVFAPDLLSLYNSHTYHMFEESHSLRLFEIQACVEFVEFFGTVSDKTDKNKTTSTNWIYLVKLERR